MKQFPLIRVKFSNEHVMAALFFVLVLYQVRIWVNRPALIVNFLIMFAAGLVIDLICNFVKYRRPVCSVSAAVTVGIIQALYPDLPVWGGLSGIAAALIFGKHLFGGTGKNLFNPAMVGVLLLSLIYPDAATVFTPTPFIIPAIVLSVPFMLVRPYASAGFISGMILMLGVNQLLRIQSLITYGVLFWACIVITDPVTVTYRPLMGLAGGFAAGAAFVFFTDGSVNFVMPVIILILNLAVYVLDITFPVKPGLKYRGSRIGRAVPPFAGRIDQVPSFVHDCQINNSDPIQGNFNTEEILKRIKACDVSGLGGAGFPVYEKIQEVIRSKAEKKFFIVNAVECDPGLIHDHWLASHFSKEISLGIALVCKVLSLKEAILAAKDMNDLQFPENVKLMKVEDFYPAGAEKVLIKNGLGISLPYDSIPAKHGILVMNVQTVIAVYEAVCFNKKAASKYLTVASLSENKSLVVKAELGTKIDDIVSTLNFDKGIVFKGGGIMQSSRAFEGDVIDKNTNFIAVGSFPRYKESPLCSKCGLCAQNCPSGLQVFKIAHLVDSREFKKASVYEPQRCISCGACSFYCLAGRNLSGRVKEAKVRGS